MTKKIISIVAIIALLAGLTACGKKNEVAGTGSTAINVTVYTVNEIGIENTVMYTGEIKASESTSVSSKLSGKASDVLVDIGTYVNAGDALLVLDGSDYRLQYNQAQASYNSAVASYNSIVNGNQQQTSIQTEQTLTSAQTEYNNAKANYEREASMYENNTNLVSVRNNRDNAKNNYEKTKQLYEIGGASEVTLDNARISYENAEASVVSTENNLKTSLESAKTRFENAELNLSTAQKNYDLTKNVLNPNNKATAQASVEQAKANLDVARNNLDNVTITAPISGYVASRNVNKGQMVSPGVELFAIKNSSIVNGEVNVTESIIPYINVGTEAMVSVKSADLENIRGGVSLVNPVKNERTGMFTVRVAIDNSEGLLKDGMFADITLKTDVKENAIAIPSNAVMQSDNELYVYIADGNTADRRTVTTGITNNEYMEILSGVNPGEKVVVSGKEYLSEKNNEINIVD